MIKPVLANRRVLVCRPEKAANELCTVLESVGAEAKPLPTIAIKAIEPTPEERSLIFDLDQFEKVIVVSQFAAEQITSLVDELWPQAPNNQTWFAIGRKTSSVLSASDLNVHAPEMDLNSEALLEVPQLQDVKAQKILIVKGRGGRSKLEQGLRDRGAKVSCIALYERLKPEYTASELTSALISFDPSAVVALSNETLDNLHSYAIQVSATLAPLTFIVPSERVALHAKALGYSKTVITEQLRPIDLIKSLAKSP